MQTGPHARMNDDQVDDIDLQIVVGTFHSVSDLDHLDSVLRAWDIKLDAAGYGEGAADKDSTLRRYYSVVSELLRKVGLPATDDPVNLTVHSVAEPAVVITDRQRVLAINAGGQQTFNCKQGDLLGLDWMDEVSRTAFAEALDHLRKGTNRTVWLFRTRTAAGLPGYAEAFLLENTKLTGSVLAIRELNVEWNDEVVTVLVEAFSLTNAEVDVASLLYQHTDIDKIAELRRVNTKTVRKQLSQLFMKTETKGQAELIRLLALLSARLASKRRAHIMAWSDPYGREKILELDGDEIAYTWMGSEAGTPALFLPGLANGYLFPTVFEDFLKSNNVKLYVVSRPGAGNCKCTSVSEPLEQHVTVVLKFCAALGLRSIVSIGLHSCVTALAAAAVRSPGTFSAIIGIGRFLQLTPERLKKVAPVPRALVWFAHNAPWAAEVIGQQAYRAMHKHGA